jgi:hypothetical protein
MASAETIHAGKSWYREASIFAEDVANVAGVSKEIAVGIIAALSPQCSWPNNKQSAINLLYTGEATGYTGYKVNIAKARRIIAGENIDTVLGKGSRYGAKVRAFYDNILNPSTSEHVTIDTHAIRAAYDIADVPRDLIRAVFESKLNVEVQDAYKKVAKEFNLVPCQFQAIVWLVVKENL